MFELLLFAAAGCALVLIALYGEMRQRNRSLFKAPKLSGKIGSRPRSPRFASASASKPQSVSRAQQEKLVRLLRGDRRAATRLVNSIQLKHPERSERWCWEKAIYDVQRDRRS